MNLVPPESSASDEKELLFFCSLLDIGLMTE
jgi:hypothetical protein